MWPLLTLTSYAITQALSRSCDSFASRDLLCMTSLSTHWAYECDMISKFQEICQCVVINMVNIGLFQ